MYTDCHKIAPRLWIVYVWTRGEDITSTAVLTTWGEYATLHIVDFPLTTDPHVGLG